MKDLQSKHLQSMARNIFVFDDEIEVGHKDTANENANEVSQPIVPPQENMWTRPLRGFLSSAFGLSNPDVSANTLLDEAALFGEDKDAIAQNDHLIPLVDEDDKREEDSSSDGLSTTLSILDSITDSLGGQDDRTTPLFLSAFKRQFLG